MFTIVTLGEVDAGVLHPNFCSSCEYLAYLLALTLVHVTHSAVQQVSKSNVQKKKENPTSTGVKIVVHSIGPQSVRIVPIAKSLTFGTIASIIFNIFDKFIGLFTATSCFSLSTWHFHCYMSVNKLCEENIALEKQLSYLTFHIDLFDGIPHRLNMVVFNIDQLLK